MHGNLSRLTRIPISQSSGKDWKRYSLFSCFIREVESPCAWNPDNWYSLVDYFLAPNSTVAFVQSIPQLFAQCWLMFSRRHVSSPEVRLSWKLACPLFSMRMSEYAHPGKFPRRFWPLSDTCRLRKLTFCTKADVLYTKKPVAKTAGGTCQDGVHVLVAMMRCARRHARSVTRYWQWVGLLVNLCSVTQVSTTHLHCNTLSTVSRSRALNCKYFAGALAFFHGKACWCLFQLRYVLGSNGCRRIGSILLGAPWVRKRFYESPSSLSCSCGWHQGFRRS